MAKKKNLKPIVALVLLEPQASAFFVLQCVLIGLCPSCKTVAKPKQFRRNGGFGCPYCSFEIEWKEAGHILSESAAFLDARLKQFEDWRHNAGQARKEDE